MKINDFYRDAAKISLNDSLAALIPPLLIVASNVFIFNKPEIMKLSIPFILYSFICFQIYLYRIKQSIQVSRCMKQTCKENDVHSILEARELLVFSQNSQSPRLELYYPNGNLAAVIKKYKKQGFLTWRLPKTYGLYNNQDLVIGLFQLKGRKIKVYDRDMSYLGSLEKKLLGRAELLDKEQRYLGSVEGSQMFMDEQVLNKNHDEVARLRRGWMPVEWSSIFPEPNTPLLTFSKKGSKEEKLVQMAFLIQQYFVER